MSENEQNPFGNRYGPYYPSAGLPGRESESSRDASPPLPDGAAFSSETYPPSRASGSLHDEQSPHWARAAAPKRGGGAVKIITFSVLVVILIAASAMVFGNLGDLREGDGRPDYYGDVFGGFDFESAEPDDGYDRDYRDYLYNYFTDSVSGSYNNIPRAATGTGVTLELCSAQNDLLSLQQVYQTIISSVCGITADGVPGSAGYSWGTGIIFSSDGYIITNAHVIDGASVVTVTLAGGEKYDAKLVGADAASDIAVLKIDAGGLVAAEFGDMSGIAVGDEVVAIGNPLGEKFSGTMTNGIISAISRDVSYQGHVMTLIQTNAALNEGNSGGPLVNMYGQVIGVTNMKMMSSYSTIEGIGFAIPVTIAKPVVDALISDGYVGGQPALGITCGSIPASAQSYYSLPRGLFVSDVAENSDAYAKGIRMGDIITHANGVPVTGTAELVEIKDALGVGDTIELTVFRGDEAFTVDVALMDRSALYARDAAPSD